MKRFHDRLLLGAACIIIAAGCSKSLHNGGEGSSGAVGEHLESNIIYNGNISLYSFNRWPEYEERKAKRVDKK